MGEARSVIAVFTILFFLSAEASVTEEQLLMRRASLEARRIHLRNIVLLGVDPVTCKKTGKPAEMMKQIGAIKKGKLNQCPALVSEKLKAIDEEIANLEKGVLVYAPIPTPDVMKTEGRQSSPVTQEVSEPLELPEVAGVLMANDKPDFTGLTAEQRKRVLEYQQIDKSRYEGFDDDDLFLMISKAYMRNLPRIWEEKPAGQ